MTKARHCARRWRPCSPSKYPVIFSIILLRALLELRWTIDIQDLPGTSLLYHWPASREEPYWLKWAVFFLPKNLQGFIVQHQRCLPSIPEELSSDPSSEPWYFLHQTRLYSFHFSHLPSVKGISCGNAYHRAACSCLITPSRHTRNLESGADCLGQTSAPPLPNCAALAIALTSLCLNLLIYKVGKILVTPS